ncbi:fumarate hydratase [Tissierella sp. MB52-C2]|uniref:fumarate hydratase n=1 Tax=Tissierella sp. MB52-C2 TaxID=3070999 RepID=UPI00280AF953|nr:fumarate hydratase [Tissierella sp. MB52-C2]WMM24188.1 fumarate hydratase [Tissierella sp. MB52-C2]
MEELNSIDEIIQKIKTALITASSSYREDQIRAFNRSITNEKLPRAKLILESLLENADIAKARKSPLCDDTGIPHIFIELGKTKALTGEILDAIREGVALGLRELPGRPMAILGSDVERLEQSGGIDEDPSSVNLAPIIIKMIEEDIIRVHILMQGGGPEIRGRTHRVFHKHSLEVILEEVISWAKEEAENLGCTPCVPAIGIGRTHFEATSLMIEAMIRGNLDKQSKLEEQITNSINESQVGALGLKGDTTALGTFLNVGPQRASGVRIVSLRLCCCVEPRVASVLL